MVTLDEDIAVIVEPWEATPIKRRLDPGVPLVAGRSADAPIRRVRIALLDAGACIRSGLGPVGRRSGCTDRAVLEGDSVGAERWHLLTAATMADIRSHGVVERVAR